MADWTAIPSSGHLKLQPSQICTNGRILSKGIPLNIDRYFGGIDSYFFFGSQHCLQQCRGQGFQPCVAVGRRRGLRVGGSFQLPLHFPQENSCLNVVVFGALWKECSSCKKDALRQNICYFKLCSKELHDYKPNVSALLCNSNWNSSTYEGLWGHRSLSKFQCRGSVAEVGSIMALEWSPAVDDVLLAISVALAYMAGIITPRSPLARQKQDIIAFQSVTSKDNPLLGWLAKEESQSNADDVWSIVQQKLTAALDVVESEGTFDTGVWDGKNTGGNHTLSLQALAKGPRLRLLRTTLNHLHKEIEKVSTNGEKIEQDDWIKLLSDILKFSCEAVCARWLQKEYSLKCTDFSEVVINAMPHKLQGNNLILPSIKESGKEDLHADLLFFLCFGSTRPGGCCHYNLLVKHAIDILEDLVIAVADGIATLYLELISMENSISNNNEWPSLVQPAFTSTRALERFRNEIALNRWLQYNFWSVVSIYEDQFHLWTLQAITVENPVATHGMKHGWWKKAISNKKVQADQLKDMVMRQIWLPLKRTKELRTLSGWRYCYSLYLEFSDIMGPLIRALLMRLGSGISFLLVSLIGRSLGLIYRGIRQSISWKS